MSSNDTVEVTFLGGLGEIGRNMATIEVAGRLAVVDVGVLFPDAEHLGVDLILADWSWLLERADDLDVIFLTHGHLDHIGALPYLLRDLGRSIDVYGTRLTIAFCEAILEEWPQLPTPRFHELEPGDRVQHGVFDVEAVQVSHSIPDGVAFAFRTPEGLIVHTGDFKLDQSPLDGRPTDLAHFARLGDEGVDLLLADSTGAENPGHVSPERTIGGTIRQHLLEAEGLVVVASFASHVHRIQQILDAAVAVGRRPVFVGRSMVRNMAIAEELGYLDFDADLVVEADSVDDHDRSDLIVISTGSQGEPFSALSLMGAGEHRRLEVGEGDLVILASSLIPGNEQAVFRSINNLSRRGCTVIHGGVAHVHVSGHASREDLVLFHNIVEPEHFVPVHGEYRHMRAHAEIARETGILPEKVFVCEDGDSLVLSGGQVTRGAGHATSHVYIDGLLDDVGPALLRDRRRIGEDGICIAIVTIDTHARRVSGDTVVTQKGVVFHEQAEGILERARQAVDQELAGLAAARFEDTAAVSRHVVQALGRFWRGETGRRPFILPVVQEA